MQCTFAPPLTFKALIFGLPSFFLLANLRRPIMASLTEVKNDVFWNKPSGLAFNLHILKWLARFFYPQWNSTAKKSALNFGIEAGGRGPKPCCVITSIVYLPLTWHQDKLASW